MLNHMKAIERIMDLAKEDAVSGIEVDTTQLELYKDDVYSTSVSGNINISWSLLAMDIWDFI